jgi:hypothetical protein
MFLLAIFLASPAATSQNITVVADPVYQSVDIQTYVNLFQPVHDSVSLPPAMTTLVIGVNQGYSSGGCPGVTAPVNEGIIHLTVGSLPQNPSDYSDGFYLLIAHEYGHLRPCAEQMNGAFLPELMAEGPSKSAYWLWHQQNPNVPAVTQVPMLDLRRNIDPEATITSYDFQNGFYGPMDDSIAGGTGEVMSGGNYLEFSAAIENIPHYSTYAEFQQKYLAAADQIFDHIDGKLPSEWLLSTPSLQEVLSPPGLFLMLEVADAQLLTLGSPGTLGIREDSPVINTLGSLNWVARQQIVDSPFEARYDGKMKYTVVDGTGKTVLSGTSDPTNDPNAGALWTTGISNGGYQINGCWVAPGASDCDPTNPHAYRTTYFAVLRDIPEYWQDWICVLENGPHYENFGKEPALRLVQNPGDPTIQTVSHPGLFCAATSLVTNITVTDGSVTRTFTRAYRDPMYQHSPTRYIPWTNWAPPKARPEKRILPVEPIGREYLRGTPPSPPTPLRAIVLSETAKPETGTVRPSLR